jgi:hypothetical protein
MSSSRDDRTSQVGLVAPNFRATRAQAIRDFCSCRLYARTSTGLRFGAGQSLRLWVPASLARRECGCLGALSAAKRHRCEKESSPSVYRQVLVVGQRIFATQNPLTFSGPSRQNIKMGKADSRSTSAWPMQHSPAGARPYCRQGAGDKIP